MLLDAASLPHRAAELVEVRRVMSGLAVDTDDVLATEEPLEIRVSFVAEGRRVQRPISVTMRTPGHDIELAVGFLFTEGLIHDAAAIKHTHACRHGNVVRVHLQEDIQVELKRLERNFYTTSSCGVCGKASIDAVRVPICRQASVDTPLVDAATISALPKTLRAAQAVFDQTGGLHASALFDSSGVLRAVREDVGRHNALDKLIGAQLLAGQSQLADSLLLVSGRVSFELVQKAAVAGIPMIVAIGAPSGLAVRLAMEHGMTLVGFTRQDRFNIYCGSQRITGLV